MQKKLYSITDNKGELYLITECKEKAYYVLYQLAKHDLDETPTNVMIEDNKHFLTIIDNHGILSSEYYLHETELVECTGSDWA